MTYKKYMTIVSLWKPECVLYIRYETKHTSGKMTMSIAFFLEMYKKIIRLLKRVKMVSIFLKNENTQIVYKYYEDLESVYEDALKGNNI